MRLLISILALPLLFSTNPVGAEEISCSNGRAGQYTCNQVDLVGELDLRRSGRRAGSGTDIWGWTDPSNGREYALMGLDSKTAFIDITDAVSPVHVGDMKTKSFSSKWRDIKVYENYAFVVSEAWGHGLQIFDLENLRGNLNAANPIQFEMDQHYDKFGSAHNIFINEDSGYAYVVGSTTCDKGAHIVDIRNPMNPTFVGCIDRDVYDLPSGANPNEDITTFGIEAFDAVLDGETYTHDIQCVMYDGPDADYKGDEICISSNENTINITNVTDKSNMYQISALYYSQTGYTHQGWLSEDHEFFFLGDELDEQRYGVNTTTFVFDFSDLDNPKLHSKFVSDNKAIDHNMYTKDGHIYQANYNAGLVILDYSNVRTSGLREVAYFDTDPNRDSATFEGVWSVYPYFPSGNVVLSHIDRGTLYIVRPNL